MLPKERKYFPTGDAVFEDRMAVLVLVPHSQQEWVYLTLTGLLDYATDLATWITSGETEPEEATQIFTTMLEGMRTMLFLVGMVSDFAAPLDPSTGWLACDGAYYNITDYQDLYNVIANNYDTGGEPSGTFRVPDLRGRVRAGLNDSSGRLPSWADSEAGTGGESDHTLTTTEMPSHTHNDTGHYHSYVPAGPNVTTIGAGAPQATAIPSVGITDVSFANLDNTGGDGAHNNVQPTMVMYPHILAKF